MKKLTLIAVAATLISWGAHGQGLCAFNNSASARVSVNSVIGGAGSAFTPAGAGSFYYALFYASSTVTTVEGSAGALIPIAGNNENTSWVWNDTNWHFAGNGQTYTDNGNTYLAQGYALSTATTGRLQSAQGAGIDDAIGGLAAGATASFVIVGWSSTIGTTWSAVQSFLTSGSLVGNMYLGESPVSLFQTGDNASTPTNPIMAGSGAVPGFTVGLLNPIPEPSTMALAALGGLSLLMFRRRK